MNDQPAQQPENDPEKENLDLPTATPDETDRTLFDLNAELAKLIEQEKAKAEQRHPDFTEIKKEQVPDPEPTNKDALGNPRLATLFASHDEIHALGTAIRMLYQFCSMALITGKNTPDETKEWLERQATLLSLKEQITAQHQTTYSNEPCDDDDDDDNCDHDH